MKKQKREAREQLDKLYHDLQLNPLLLKRALDAIAMQTALDAIDKVVRETKDLRIIKRIAGDTVGRGHYSQIVSAMDLCPREPELFLRFADDIVRAHAARKKRRNVNH